MNTCPDSYTPFETGPFEVSLQKVLDWAKGQNYEGYSKFDAFNSPVVRAACLGNRYLRMAAMRWIAPAWPKPTSE